MRSVSLVSGLVSKVRRAVTKSASVDTSDAVGAEDPAKIARSLREAMARIDALEAKSPGEATEFEVNVGLGGALTELVHNAKGPVRWWVTSWLQTSGSVYPVSGPQLAQDSSSTATSLFLRSYVPGRAVVRVEPSQAYLETGVVVRPVPLVSEFTVIQAGGRAAVNTDTRGGIVMTTTNGANAEDYRLLKKLAPTAAYTLTVHMYPTLNPTGTPGAGILWRASGSGNCNFYGLAASAGAIFIWAANTGASNNGASPAYTFSAAVLNAFENYTSQGNGVWLRIADDLTNRTWSYSIDGFNFKQLATAVRTSYITPDEIGLWIGSTAATGATDVTAFFDSWVIS